MSVQADKNFNDVTIYNIQFHWSEPTKKETASKAVEYFMFNYKTNSIRITQRSANPLEEPAIVF